MNLVWSVPPAWAARTAFILGGGPSLAGIDVDALRGRGAIIAINDAGLIKAPWADVHYFCDPRWMDWHERELGLFTGPYRVTRAPADWLAGELVLLVLEREKAAPLSVDAHRVAGPDSGSNAINLAFLFGTRRIVLFGFDMRPGNWHDRHRRVTPPQRYGEKFIPALERMAIALKREGVEVINATPGSALTCFPIVSPDNVLLTVA